MSIQKVNCTKYNIIQWYNSPRRVYTNSSDCISFKAKTPMLLSPEEGEKASEKLKKSTAGYRADIHKEFNDKFVFTMTHAVIKYMKDRNQKATLVGGDTREATKK